MSTTDLWLPVVENVKKVKKIHTPYTLQCATPLKQYWNGVLFRKTGKQSLL
jgi:hypothetical protein